jgi:hypothetical protein
LKETHVCGISKVFHIHVVNDAVKKSEDEDLSKVLSKLKERQEFDKRRIEQEQIQTKGGKIVESNEHEKKLKKPMEFDALSSSPDFLSSLLSALSKALVVNGE